MFGKKAYVLYMVLIVLVVISSGAVAKKVTKVKATPVPTLAPAKATPAPVQATPAPAQTSATVKTTPAAVAKTTPAPVTASVTYTGDNVLEMATKLADEIDAQGKAIPAEAEIAGKKISIEDTMYLMAQWLVQYGQAGLQQAPAMPEKIAFIDVTKPDKFEVDNGAADGTITWPNLYKAGADAVALLEKSPKLFDGMTVSITKGSDTADSAISADSLIYVFARTIRWVYNNNQMPNYGSVKPVIPPTLK